MRSILELLQNSPFFEVLEHEDLQALADVARLETLDQGEMLLSEGDPAETLYMLAVGKVQLFFVPTESGPEARDRKILVRTISEPGRVIGWSAMVEPYHYRASALALEDTHVLAFDRQWLEDYSENHPQFGVRLMKRILWVLGNRLRESRIRLVAQRFEQEILAIRALLDQSAEQLHVSSPLLKIPLYLENRLTLSDAFHTLELLQVHGDELERNLSELCLDILRGVHKELEIYQQLQAIYEHVASAPGTASPTTVRRRCCEEFIKLFEHVRHVISGEQHLPNQSGHIFIMNHLENHPENALPNEFRLTLDTHFVSAMILYKKYQEAPIRVIRKSNPDEYGHQKYYDRLGYIYVYAGHVDEDVDNPTLLAEERRRYFFDTARSELLSGKNIVICPEGACEATEKSPLPFKAGAFRLASLVRPEPMIVPIAVANFDKKLTRTTVVAVVHKPFLLSSYLPDGADDEAFFDFVNSYQRQFRDFVREAANMADQLTTV